ncbi:MAG TPA: glycosyltransferase family 4 protein [Chitinophagaceae bacterium]|nr:glycosyltransferase family 4 protein [Chitinophagaceae bacterium]
MALKILILTPRIPFPLRDGGSIAMNQTLEGYIEQGCEVSLLALNTSRHWVDEASLPALYKKLVHFESVYIKTDVNPLSAFFNLFTDKSYNVERFVNKQIEQCLIRLLQIETFDIIQFESIYTAPYLKTARKYSDARCVCRVHNIEHLIWQRLTENEKSYLKKKYLQLLTNRLYNYEMDVIKQFDLLLPISTKEEAFFNEQKLNRCIYLPFGIQERDIDTSNIPFDENSCYHIGSMDWAPNIEGVQWFLEEIWSKASVLLPEVTFYLAGKNMPPSLLSKENKQIDVVGEVDDFVQFSLEKNIMIVPLLSGAGIRVKILEAMSLGKTIITTTIGAEGIGGTHKKNILICDTVDEFVETIQFCFHEREQAKKIGLQAKAFVNTYFQKHKIYTDIIKQLTALVNA